MNDPGYGEEFDIAVDEITDQYLANEIQGEDREKVENYFFKSPQRRDKLKYAATLRTYQLQQPRRTKWWTSPQFRIAASIILVVTVALGLHQILRQSPGNDGMLALQADYRDQRPLEARIVSLNYAPAVSLRGASRVDSVQRDRAASLIENAATENRNATSLHHLGTLSLTDRQFDKAIEHLEAALALSPQDAAIHSDLGTALMEKGKIQLSDSDQGKAVDLFGKSLTHLTKALELDNSRLEALFNRALLYGYMGLPEKAEQDWRQYLERDPNSQWSNEARERLKSIEDTHSTSGATSEFYSIVPMT